MNLQKDDMIQCGIVGWKDSGKTFLVQRLIDYFPGSEFYDKGRESLKQLQIK